MADQMIISIVGAGAMGSSVAGTLLLHDDVSEIRILDSRAASLQALSPISSSPKLKPYKLNAKDHIAVGEVVAGSACVISCVEPEENYQLARVALEVGAHFVDEGGNEDTTLKTLELADEAKAKGKWVVPNCGLAPGLVDIACVYAIEQFDQAEGAYLRVGSIPLHPNPPLNCHLSSSPGKMLDDYSAPTYLIEDGELKRVPSLSGEEQIFFDEPFGMLEAFYSAAGTSLLARELEGTVNHLDFKTISRPGHADQMSFLLELGLAKDNIIDVRTHLTFRDVLIRKMRLLLGGTKKDAVLIRILVTGFLNGEQKTLVLQSVNTFNDATGMSALRTVAGTATAEVAYLLAAGQIPGGGASPPEQILDKSRFLEILAGRGVTLESSWHDGHLSIADVLPSLQRRELTR